MSMYYKSCQASTVVILIAVAFISVREPVSGYYTNVQRPPNAGQQWQNPNQQQQQAGPYAPPWQGPNQNPNPTPPSPHYQNPVLDFMPSVNRTVGHYESSAHSDNGRKLGRMIDTYSTQLGDMGAALDKVADILQHQLQEAQQNQGQGMPAQNQNPGQNAYTKRPWSSGYSKKPWVPYEEYIATRKAWSPSAKTWSPWSKWSPAGNEGYSPKTWSPNPAYSKKTWSPYQKSWSPNPAYSKKPWSPHPGQTQQKWGSGWYSNQPWVPNNNQQQKALFDGPGMEADDFAMDSPVVTEPETKSKRTRKSTTREVEVGHQTEPVLDGVDNKMGDPAQHDTEPSFTKSGENVHGDFKPDISVER